jgi:FkbM family methyltransferase
MLGKIYDWYALLFAKSYFIKLNKFLYNLSIRGLGVLNYRSETLRGEYNWLEKYLSDIEQPFVVDVGANIGNYTHDIKKINSLAEVIAIEPHPITYKRLSENISILENVKTFNYAIGKDEGILELFDYKDNDGSSHASLYKEVIQDLHKGAVVSHKVNIVKLDDLLKDIDCDIDLLKIDTEGNEFNVLLGSKELLNSNRIKAIHFEFNEMNIISKVTFKDFWDFLSKQYDFYRILPYGDLLAIKNYSPMYCEIYHYQNIICLKK